MGLRVHPYIPDVTRTLVLSGLCGLIVVCATLNWAMAMSGAMDAGVITRNPNRLQGAGIIVRIGQK